MANTVDLTIISNVRSFPYEKRYPSTMTLCDLKKKLELVVGTRSDNMNTELYAKDGSFLATLSNDCATLENLGVQSGMKIYVQDKTGNAANYLDDASTVEKYTIDEESYDQREKSLRAWKRREGFGPPSLEQRLLENEKAASNLQTGNRCVVKTRGKPERFGTISYVGQTKFKPGWWVGVTYDEPVGKNDGSVNGERYFTCAEMYGGFVRPVDVIQLEAQADESMEEI